MASWGKCDFRQLKDLQKRMEKLQKVDYDGFCRATANELAAKLLHLVKLRTPVGHKPRIAAKDENDKKALGGVNAKGTLRVKGVSGKSKTLLSREGEILNRYWSGYTGGTLRREWTAKPITRIGGMYVVEIINPKNYASYVEYGHRQLPGRYVPALGKQLKAGWVKGRFMLTISEQELQAQAPAIIEKKLNKLLGECFNGK